MATGTVSFRYFVLGLLAHQPMSGYDIKCFLKSLDWLVGNPSFGAIYPALHALLQDGWVTVETLAYSNRPPRKIYTITEAGETALRVWIEQPPAPSASLKAFIMHLILVGGLSHKGVVAHLRRRRGDMSAHHAALAQAVEELGERANLGQRLAMEYGLAVADAELTWLDDMLDRLSAESGTDFSAGIT